MNEYNYKYTTESILPRTLPRDLKKAFADRYSTSYWKQVIDTKISKSEQYMLLETLVKLDQYYKLTFAQQRRIWNAHCIARWSRSILIASTVDDYGFIKYKDMGYEPKQREEWEIDCEEPQQDDSDTHYL